MGTISASIITKIGKRDVQNRTSLIKEEVSENSWQGLCQLISREWDKSVECKVKAAVSILHETHWSIDSRRAMDKQNNIIYQQHGRIQTMQANHATFVDAMVLIRLCSYLDLNFILLFDSIFPVIFFRFYHKFLNPLFLNSFRKKYCPMMQVQSLQNVLQYSTFFVILDFEFHFWPQIDISLVFNGSMLLVDLIFSVCCLCRDYSNIFLVFRT